MDTTSGQIPRACPLGDRVLVVSRDWNVANQLKAYLRQDYGCNTQVVTSYEAAERHLRAPEAHWRANRSSVCCGYGRFHHGVGS